MDLDLNLEGFLWLTGRKEYYNYSKTSVLATDNYLSNPEKSK